MMREAIAPNALHTLLLGDAEHALIDVREMEPFSRRHLLFAVPLPVGRIELLVADLLPCPATPIIVCDDGEGLAARAASRLDELGYRDVRVLQGGISGWVAAGYPVYSGVNVPSKAFGEFIEHKEGTPSLSAREVHEMMQSGEDMIILDSRPFDEFHWASIPRGLCCSGAELVYRGFTAVPSAETKVIVNCAGRTRSIIGAQSLINAGLPNPVYALRNGIMGWRLAGLEPAVQQVDWAPAPDPDGLSKSQAAAESVAARFHLQEMTEEELEVWRCERPLRSLFVLDVRTIEEYEAGHLGDAVHAPGGQVIQATDQYIGARNARIVLVDNDGVRAGMTASWLLQMGQRDVHVLRLDRVNQALKTGSRRAPVQCLDDALVAGLSTDDAERILGHDGLVLDASMSSAYRHGHIAGAWFILRSQLAESLQALPAASAYVLTSEDGTLAAFAAAELAEMTETPVFCIDGGNEAWVKAGKSMVQGDEHYAVDPIDLWRNPFATNRATGETAEDAMRAYLDWEVDLMEQLGKDDTMRFRTVPRES